jgi:hypothetical protein
MMGTVETVVTRTREVGRSLLRRGRKERRRGKLLIRGPSGGTRSTSKMTEE